MASSEDLRVEIIVDASGFMNDDVFNAIESRILSIYEKQIRSKGSSSDWVWFISVSADQVESYVKTGREKVTDSVGRFVKRQLKKYIRVVMAILRSHVGGDKDLVVSTGGASITIPKLRPSTAKIKKSNSRYEEGFFHKESFSAISLISTASMKLDSSSGGIMVYSWVSNNENWESFNLGLPSNNQVPRPVIDILRGYLSEAVTDLAKYLDNSSYESYEDVARLVDGRV